MMQEWGIPSVTGELSVGCGPCPPGAAQPSQVSRVPSAPGSFLQGHNQEHPSVSEEYGEEGSE